MRTLFIDTNVALDVVLDRSPLAHESGRVLQEVATGACRGWLSSLSVVTVWYVTRRHGGRERAQEAVLYLHDLLAIAPVTAAEIAVALTDHRSGAFADFEDAVQHAAALAAGAEALVTRNARDFAGARLPILSPAELLAR